MLVTLNSNRVSPYTPTILVTFEDERRGRRDAKLPLEAEPDVAQHRQHGDAQRHESVLEELAAHGGTDGLDALKRRVGEIPLQVGAHLADRLLLRRVAARLALEPDFDIVG